MALGGWTTSTTLMKHYVEESYLLPAVAAPIYSWLVENPPLVTSDRVQRVGDPAIADDLPPGPSASVEEEPAPKKFKALNDLV